VQLPLSVETNGVLVLCATDFSGVADLGLTHALRLARRMSAELLIVHVATRHDEAAALALERLRGEVESNGVPCQAWLLHGAVVPTLLQLVEETGPELVVVGSHGRGLISRLVLGSIAEALSRRSSSPVLIVTDPARREAEHEDTAL
jgi:nucleotide-binding universal stress UspA family protein